MNGFIKKYYKIILNGTQPVTSGATVCEFYEIKNHKQAFSNLWDHLENNDKLSVSIIKEIHADLTDRLQYDKRQFKKNENMIIGAEIQIGTYIQFERIHPFSDGNGRIGHVLMKY